MRSRHVVGEHQFVLTKLIQGRLDKEFVESRYRYINKIIRVIGVRQSYVLPELCCAAIN